MIKKRVLITLTLILSLSTIEAKGSLVIIGGGKRPPELMKKIIELAGGENAKIVVIPNASSEPIETAEYQVNQFKSLGAVNTDFIFAEGKELNSESTLEKLMGVTGIFFSGGDQRRLASHLLNSKMLKRIEEIYESGGVIAGTSAGAAVMSKIMITGDEKKYPDAKSAFTTIESENIITSDGFGFLTNCIIDQHFIYRKRHNRLISLVLENPALTGIGIDESTAIVVNSDHECEVLGDYQVIVYRTDEKSEIKQNSGGLFSGALSMEVFLSGDRFIIEPEKCVEN